MSMPDDLRVIEQVQRRRESPEMAAAFAGAVRKLFGDLGWWTDLADEAGDFACVPPVYDDVRAVFHANAGGFVDVRQGATNERHVDIVHLITRALALASHGVGRLPESPSDIRMLVPRVVARSEGLTLTDTEFEAWAAVPPVRRAVEAIMAGLDTSRSTAHQTRDPE
ncbi:hypothetical protein [Burkholderia ambifaria]|uniref:hypothetical protein n=1 Tax=Burkholderia ambifaria TaxID=152480 RepID=UPI00158B7A53|nr:hypothetical protein [Burkholderia ambifaria]